MNILLSGFIGFVVAAVMCIVLLSLAIKYFGAEEPEWVRQLDRELDADRFDKKSQ